MFSNLIYYYFIIFNLKSKKNFCKNYIIIVLFTHFEPFNWDLLSEQDEEPDLSIKLNKK